MESDYPANAAEPELSREFSAEFALVLACCSWPVDTGRVRLRASHVENWDFFLAIARRQRVMALAHWALKQASVTLPAPVADMLEHVSRQTAQQALMMAATAIKIRDLLEGANIRAVFLKGASLAQLAYGTIALKHAKDIDILVLPEQVEEVWFLLEAHGYRCNWGTLSRSQIAALVQHDNQAEFLGDGPQIELHWRLSRNRYLMQHANSLSATQDVPVSRTGHLPTLADADLFCYLCVHGAAHMWFRLKWLADLSAFLADKTAEQKIALFQHAERCGADLCAGQALLLMEGLFGQAVPAPLSARLAHDGRFQRLRDMAIRTMTAGNAVAEMEDIPFAITRLNLSSFRLGRGLRFHAAQLRHAAVALPDVMSLRLPRPLWFLYPVVRVPLWLSRQISFGARIRRRAC